MQKCILKFGQSKDFKMDFLAISIWKIEILTPLYLGNRGIKWGVGAFKI